MVSDVRQSRKNKYCVIPFIQGTHTRHMQSHRMVVAKARGKGELVISGDRVSVLQDEEVTEMDGGNSCTITGMS